MHFGRNSATAVAFLTLFIAVSVQAQVCTQDSDCPGGFVCNTTVALCETPFVPSGEGDLCLSGLDSECEGGLVCTQPGLYCANPAVPGTWNTLCTTDAQCDGLLACDVYPDPSLGCTDGPHAFKVGRYPNTIASEPWNLGRSAMVCADGFPAGNPVQACVVATGDASRRVAIYRANDLSVPETVIWMNDGTAQDMGRVRVRSPFGDVTGDGEADLLVCGRNQCRVYPGPFPDTGTGEVRANLLTPPVRLQTAGTNVQSTAAELADFNNDGIMDVIMHQTGGRTSIFYGPLASGTYIPNWVLGDVYFTHGIAPFGETIAVGDYNGDGNLDVVLGRDNEAFLFEGPFAPGPVYTTSSLPGAHVAKHRFAESGGGSAWWEFSWSIQLADMDKDGFDDIIIGGRRIALPGNPTGVGAGEVYIFKGNYPYPGTNVNTLSAAYRWYGTRANGYLGDRVEVGDIDGDGDPDLVVGSLEGTGNGELYAVRGPWTLDPTSQVLGGLGPANAIIPQGALTEAYYEATFALVRAGPGPALQILVSLPFADIPGWIDRGVLELYADVCGGACAYVPRRAKLGETCTKDADCETRLVCDPFANTCKDGPGTAVAGDFCTQNRDCEGGLVCNNCPLQNAFGTVNAGIFNRGERVACTDNFSASGSTGSFCLSTARGYFGVMYAVINGGGTSLPTQRSLITVFPSGGLGRVTRPFGDVNGDGETDLLLCGPADCRILLGPIPSGAFGYTLLGFVTFQNEGTGGTPSTQWSSAELADLNGDGIDDIVLHRRTQEVAIHFGPFTAGSVFTNTGPADYLIQGYAPGRIGQTIAVGDMDGDGNLDVALTDITNFQRVYVFTGPFLAEMSPRSYSTANAVFRNFGSGATTFGRGEILLRDLDGDGAAELIVGSYSSSNAASNGGQIAIWKGGDISSYATEPVNSGGQFGNHPPTAVIDGAIAGGLFGWFFNTGDINGDGIPDLIATGYLNLGSTVSGPAWIFLGPWDLATPSPSSTPATTVVAEGGVQSFSGFNFFNTGRGSIGVANLDGDAEGRQEFVVGAPPAASSQGGHYIYGTACRGECAAPFVPAPLGDPCPGGLDSECEGGLVCELNVCAPYFVPSPLGTPCAVDTDCEGGLICSPSLLVCGNYFIPAALGEPCASGDDAECQGGLVCNATSLVCEERFVPAQNGEACNPANGDADCAGGLVCNSASALCEPYFVPGVVGDPCPGGDSDCEGPLVCGLTSSLCELPFVPAPFADPCTVDQDCEGGLICDPVSFLCGNYFVPLPAGSECSVNDECEGGLVCESDRDETGDQLPAPPANRTCRDPWLGTGPGGACVVSDTCLGGYRCLYGVCSTCAHANLDEGSECTQHSDCTFGTYCPNGTCVVGPPLAPEGADCDVDSDCVGGLYCSKKYGCKLPKYAGEPCGLEEGDSHSNTIGTGHYSHGSGKGKGHHKYASDGQCRGGLICFNFTCQYPTIALPFGAPCNISDVCQDGLECDNGIDGDDFNTQAQAYCRPAADAPNCHVCENCPFEEFGGAKGWLKKKRARNTKKPTRRLFSTPGMPPIPAAETAPAAPVVDAAGRKMLNVLDTAPHTTVGVWDSQNSVWVSYTLDEFDEKFHHREHNDDERVVAIWALVLIPISAFFVGVALAGPTCNLIGKNSGQYGKVPNDDDDSDYGGGHVGHRRGAPMTIVVKNSRRVPLYP